ncbi:MAG: rod shape-determining protein MreD [Bacillota bacterium]
MRVLIISVLLIVNMILEATLLQSVRIFGVKPDFAIMIIVAFSILRGSSYGAFIGFGSGLLVDMMFGRTIGINALSYMLTGYIIGQAHENVFKDSIIPAVIFNAAAIIISQHIFFVLAYFSQNITSDGISYLNALTSIILPQCLYNAVIGGLLYKLLYRLDEMDIMDKRIY